MQHQQALNFEQIERYYRLLGVPRDCTWPDVQRSYRKAAQRLHPDKADGRDPAKFHELNQAYTSLKKYYQTFGVLPSLEPSATEPATAKPAAAAKPPPAPDNQPRQRLGTIMALLAIPPLLYLTWPREAAPPASTDRLKPTVKTPATAVQPRITIGLSKQEVLRIQGQPLLTSQQKWDYGVSSIYFENGLVIGWYNARSAPLRVSPDHYGSVGDTRSNF